MKRKDDIFRTSLKPRLEGGLPSSGGLSGLLIIDVPKPISKLEATVPYISIGYRV